MNSQELLLYERIQHFNLDNTDELIPFSKKLARSNNWTIEYTHRVIEEYRKFVFLAVVHRHTVTPSEQVDVILDGAFLVHIGQYLGKTDAL